MATMGRYCKAYAVNRFMEYSGWKGKARNVKIELQESDGEEKEVQRELRDDDYLFLQESLIVTDGIFIDQNIIYEDDSPEWRAFCQENLKFDVHVYSHAEKSGVESAAETAGR
jgi:hypothetical protein